MGRQLGLRSKEYKLKKQEAMATQLKEEATRDLTKKISLPVLERLCL